MNDEVIKLILETQGVQGLQELIAKATQLKDALRETYEVGERQVGVYNLASTAAERAKDREVAAAVEATRAHRLMSQSLDDVDKTAERASRSTRNFGRSALEAGRFIQDFQAAGLNGVLNNLEGLALALGGGAGLAGVLTLLGVAIYQYGDKIWEFFESFEKGPQKAAENLKVFTDEMQKAYDKIQELQYQANKSDPRQAEAFRQTLLKTGGADAFLAELTGMGYSREDALGIVQGGLQGNIGQIGRAQLASGRFRDAFIEFDPKIEADQKENAKRSAEFQRKQKQEQEKRDRETEQLNRMGQDNEEAFRRDAERQQEKEASEAKRKAEQAAKEAPFNDARSLIQQFDRANGLGFTGAQIDDAAKMALDLADQGVSTNEAILGAVQATYANMYRTMQQLQRQQAQAQQFGMMFGNLQQQSETFFGMW